ncbi:CDK2-associated and cullin domain-containing protein 1-like [Actinia tenebrosa]|uniref:CDK2-associated and cullin domain-containing protein 1-like n=1 Tax=Actinia tenebrosa TaxID=6105 RepID=A0A6P8H1P9_ACTTE|nr:CDK2-associated and cullin domain-containing protein 1-like [Actinia tenebrosa]
MGETNVISNTNNEFSSLLRPQRIPPVSDIEYSAQFWPKLEGAILLILRQNPGEFIPISYEEMYSAVYKCVCQQYSEIMYKNLIDLVTIHLTEVTKDLQGTSGKTYLEKFDFLMAQYLQAVTGIVAIFNYMNRFYVVPKLHADLTVELKRLFTEIVADNPFLFNMIDEVSQNPFAVSPHTMMSVIKGLYSLKPEFAERNPSLFAKYVPNLLPASRHQDLPLFIEETRQLQRDLIDQYGYTRENSDRKRRGDELQGDSE